MEVMKAVVVVAAGGVILRKKPEPGNHLRGLISCRGPDYEERTTRSDRETMERGAHSGPQPKE